MRIKASNFLLVAVWVSAIVTAIFSARYFVLSADTLAMIEDRAAVAVGRMFNAPPLPAVHPFSHHPVMLLIHVGAGIVAITAGLFQFKSGLRESRPRLHRGLGYVYSSAVAIGTIPALPLSFMFFDPLPPELRARMMPAVVGFATLSIVWAFTTGLAVYHARHLRFDQHRAWMLRSYSLTFAAATVRLFTPIALMLTHDPLTATDLVICSWPLNLLAAEWLVRKPSLVLSVRKG